MNRERFGRRLRLVAAKQGADLLADQRVDQDPVDDAEQPAEGGPAEASPRRSPLVIWRRTPLRARLALAATIAVAAGVGGGVGFAYVAVRHSLTKQVDGFADEAGHRMRLQQLRPRTGTTRTDKIPPFDSTPEPGETRVNIQFINAKGQTMAPTWRSPPRDGAP